MGSSRRDHKPGGDLASFEMAEEFLPFGVGGHPVLFAGPQAPPPGEEGQVGLDGLIGVDRLVAERDVDVPVTCDDLGDVRRQPVHETGREQCSNRAEYPSPEREAGSYSPGW